MSPVDTHPPERALAGDQAGGVATVMWERDVAEVYDETTARDVRAGGRSTPSWTSSPRSPATVGRWSWPSGRGGWRCRCAARGVPVCGIELSPHMVDQLRAKPGADGVPVTIGDMTTARVEGPFTLVYLVFNTIMNVTTQDEQVAVFANAAAHLEPGGCFVVEVAVPQLRRLPPGELGRVFEMQPGHVGHRDVRRPRRSGHVVAPLDGRATGASSATPRRTATCGRPSSTSWPSSPASASATAGPAGRGEPFTSASTSQVAVFERPA